MALSDSAIFKESTDFNNDGEFTSADIDAAWTYLQLKKLRLLEMESGGDATITEQNFTEKYIELFNTNKASNIIDAESTTPVSLPGELRTAADFGTRKQPEIVKRWDFNKTDQPGGSGTVLESIGGDKDSTYSGCAWPVSTAASADLFSIWSSGTVSLRDKGAISNSTWCMQIKGTLNYYDKINRATIFKKGDFGVGFWRGKNGEGLYVASSSGIGYLRFAVPITDLANKSFTLTVVREGVSIRILWDDTWLRFGFPNEFPALLSEQDITDAAIEFTQTTPKLESVVITGPGWGAQDIVNTKGDVSTAWHKYSARMDCDTTYAFFGWAHRFPDLYGNFCYLTNMPYGLGADGSKHWVAPPTVTETNGYVAKETCLHLNGKQYCSLPSVSFLKDFTLSFWMKCDYITWAPFFRFVSVSDATKVLEINLDSADKLGITITGRSNTIKKPFAGFSPGQSEQTWNHITMMKNGSRFNIWVNGQCGGWTNIPLSDTECETLGECTPILKPPSSNKNNYVSHIRVVKYAMSHVPVENLKNQTTWQFIEDLKQPFQTSVLPWTP